MIRINFELEEKFHRKVKAAAAIAGKTIKQWVTEACSDKLKKEGK